MAVVAEPDARSLSYHEPDFPQLAIITSFLYLLQVLRNVADRIFGAGLLGEIAVGIIYGPVTGLLLNDFIILVGYLGLVLIVFEGGLNISPTFISGIHLAFIAALIGILLPLAFTFGLFHAFGYPSLWAFSAGSALASTSLGTTFFVLKTQSEKEGLDLSSTRIGAVLQGAALVDDIIALVLLSVITALGQGDGSTGGNLGWTIGRPIVASIAMAVVAPLVTLYIARPLWRRTRLEGWCQRGGQNAQLGTGVVVLVGFLSIAYYVKTTMLLGAFLAGVFLYALPSPTASSVNFAKTYQQLVEPVHKYFLASLFFASIGLSIPFLDLWTGKIIWRGVVYSILMTLAKVLVGVLILALDLFNIGASGVDDANNGHEMPSRMQQMELSEFQIGNSDPVANATTSDGVFDVSGTATIVDGHEYPKEGAGNTKNKPNTRNRSARLWRDSLTTASFLGFALVARGEIGVLVLQVAYNAAPAGQTNPVGQGSRVLGTEAYLVSIWATALCTIVGPVAFSFVVRKYGQQIYRGRWGAPVNTGPGVDHSLR